MVGAVIVIAMLGGVVWFVGAPIRGARGRAGGQTVDDGRAGLEAAKEAKYREIRDTEMDHRTGKLSVEDYRRLDRALRAEAIDILRRLDELGPGPAARPPGRASV
jgi:hypothetical protein